MKNSKIVFVIFLFISAICTNCTQNSNNSIKSKDTITQKFDSTNSIHEDSEDSIKTFSYNNPSVFVGSDFGNYFNILYRIGKFNDMVKWTYSGSLSKFGRENIKNFYKEKLKFGFELGHLTSMNKEGDTVILNYNANIIATKRVIRLKIIVENDSCKMVISSLNNKEL